MDYLVVTSNNNSIAEIGSDLNSSTATAGGHDTNASEHIYSNSQHFKFEVLETTV